MAGSRTGVYVGISTSDYAHLLTREGGRAIGPYLGTGNAHAAAAGRISYVLGLEGPCLAIDTACSSFAGGPQPGMPGPATRRL